eukprot:1395435-Ditylum_brightwellii.AAC.1
MESSLSAATVIEQVKSQGNLEVLSYLIATETTEKPKFDPLEWWRVNKSRFVNTAKHLRLCGKLIENQVFIHDDKSHS